MKENVTHITLLSNHPVLSAGFRAVIEKSSQFTCASFRGTDLQLFRDHAGESGIILADTACGLTLDFLHDLRIGAPDASIVLWVDAVSTEFVSQALSMGVLGVLPKTASIELYMECLNYAAARRTWVENSISIQLLDTRRVKLTRRERELTTLLAQGLKNKEVAIRMGISEGSVKVYLSRLYTKLGVNDRFDLAMLTLRNMSTDQTGIAKITMPVSSKTHLSETSMHRLSQMAIQVQ